MKIFILSLVVIGLLVGGAVFAQDAVIQEEVTSDDLGIEDPGLLPTSPFYFFKEFSRGIQSVLTFNPVKKAELELRFVNEKAAEAKRVQETEGDDESAVNRAIDNYRVSQERLASRLQALSETSNNPNIDILLDKVTEKIVLHEKLFDEIELRVKSKIEIRDGIESVREKIRITIGRVAEKDNPERFKARLEEVLEDAKGGTLKHVRSVEFLDRIDGVIPEDKREFLSQLRERLSVELGNRLETEVDRDGVEKLKERIKNIGGDGIDRVLLFEELKTRGSDNLSKALRAVQDDLKDDGRRMQEKTEEQVQRAIRAILKAREAMEGKDIPKAVSLLIETAEKHIVVAKEAFANENYTNAFGQARSAETAARNALSILSHGSVVDNVQLLERVELRRDTTTLPPKDSSGTVCTLEYNPVCGANGETYSNPCLARVAGAEIVKKGTCEAQLEIPSIINDIRTRLVEPLQIKRIPTTDVNE